MTTQVLLIDNYDSFVYNLARYFAELGCGADVVRNDVVTAADIRRRQPAAIVLSPGPCTPQESGVCIDVVRECGAHVPILGVCLGHQAIAVACGGNVVRADEPVHGRTSEVFHDGHGLFEGLPSPLTATRYHSLVVEESSLPDALTVTARTAEGTIMALRHRDWPTFGVQFHPESVLSEQGHRLLVNFLAFAGIRAQRPSFQERRDRPQDDDFFGRSIHRDHPPPTSSAPQ